MADALKLRFLLSTVLTVFCIFNLQCSFAGDEAKLTPAGAAILKQVAALELQNATELNKREQYSAAIRAIEKAVSIFPNLAQAYDERSYSYNCLGRFNEALADANKAIALNPRLDRAYVNRAIANRGLGKLQSIEADCNKAISLYPKNREAYSLRAFSRVNSGQFKEALSDCNKAIEFNKDLGDSYIIRSKVWAALGKYSEAVKDCDFAIRLNKRDPSAYSNRAAAKMKLQQFNEALQDVGLAELYAPKPRIPAIEKRCAILRGEAYFGLRKFSNAIVECNNALALDPKFSDALVLRSKSKQALATLK